MSNLMYDILIFGICVEIVSYLTWMFGFFGTALAYPFGSPTSGMFNMQQAFQPDLWMGLIAGIGAITGIVSLLLRNGTYALYALLVFAFGIFYKWVVPIVMAIPNTVAALLPGTTNPLAYTNGVYNPAYTGENPIQVVIALIVGFAMFIFLLEFVLQRKVS